MQPETSGNGRTSVHIRSSSAYALKLDDLVTPQHLLYQATRTTTVEGGCRLMSFLRASKKRSVARLRAYWTGCLPPGCRAWVLMGY